MTAAKVSNLASSPGLKPFVAIPRGDFYCVQAEAIRTVLEGAGVQAYVAEDDPSTKGLWESIQQEIDDADLFIADISSRSPEYLTVPAGSRA